MLSGDNCDFLALIFTPFRNRQNPPNPEIERAARPFQYIRETALRDQARERFSALTLPRILSVLSSKLTF
jgi:hypothetical protein